MTAGGWRSMDTAPRDGTLVLGLFQDVPGAEPSREDAKLRVYFNPDWGWLREGQGERWTRLERLVREPDGWRPLGGTA